LAKNKAAGEALTVKKVPHRPGTAPALGLRAEWFAAVIHDQRVTMSYRTLNGTATTRDKD
jgi:hypothetical protein